MIKKKKAQHSSDEHVKAEVRQNKNHEWMMESSVR